MESCHHSNNNCYNSKPLTSPSFPSPLNPTTPFAATTPNTTIDSNQQKINNISSGYSTYSDPILGISIQYPSNYEVSEGPSGVGFASLSFGALPPINSPEFSLLEVSVTVEDVLSPAMDSERFMREKMNEQRRYQINILALNETALSGNHSVYQTVYTTFDTMPIHSQSMGLFLVKDGRGYLFL